jgi:asparagine synthase (glutamine-hydrolysing)
MPSLLNCTVLLEDPHTTFYSVKSSDGTCLHGRGYAFLDNGDYANGPRFLNHLLGNCPGPKDRTFNKLRELIPRLNGSWAFIATCSDGSVLAASDRSRSIPLFYSRMPAGLVISCSARQILNELGDFRISEAGAAELLLSGYVSNNGTIYQGIHQIQPAEILEYSAQTSWEVVSSGYFYYFPENSCTASESQLKAELEDIVEAVFARFAKALKNRRIILPLSGGLDSRLIAWMLYKNGIRNITCYTYGEKGNQQNEIARRVAECLQFKWRFIEYNSSRWAQCMGSSRMQEYWQYAFRGSALPHLQDFPAYFSMESDFDNEDRPVVLPGHVGDAWASEFALQRFDQCAFHPLCENHSDYMLIEDDPVVAAVIYRHLNLWPVSRQKWLANPWIQVASKIRSTVNSFVPPKPDRIWMYIEWVLRNRTALWILRTFRCVEYFGGENHLCLGDYELINFFRKLPLEMLNYRRLYSETLRDRIFNRVMCPVRDIPIRSGASAEKTLKRTILENLQKFGLYRHYEKVRRVVSPRKALAADTWFTRGKAAHAVTIGQALEPFDIQRNLPFRHMEIITPFIDHPAYSIQCNGLLAAAVLAREFALHPIQAE